MSESHLEVINPLKDESNPTSVINLVPSLIARPLKCIPEDVFDLSISELEEVARVGEIERKLRIAFWIEYERAQRTSTMINMASVYKGICSTSNFSKYVVTNSFKLAYILTPPEDYRVAMEEMLMLALKAERKTLQTPIEQTRIITNKQGEQKTIQVIDAQLAMVQHKIRESLQNRIVGMPIHRSMQITQNTNINHSVQNNDASSGPSAEALAQMSGEDLKSFVKSLQEQNGSHASDAIEVRAVNVTGGAMDGKGS